jgi:hypothetical protein
MTSAGPLSGQRHEELLQQIGGDLLDVVPDGFRRIDVMVKSLVSVRDVIMTVYMADGSTPAVPPPPRLDAAFAELRRLVHRPGRGTWFTARCVVNAPSRITINYNLDHDPLMFPPVPASGFARDLEAFPRDRSHIPDWLRTKLAEARAEERRA